MSNDTETEDIILPPEIILHIIGYLDPDSDKDRTALARCAQISPMFRYDAQKRLFCSVTVPYGLIRDSDQPRGEIGTVDTRKSQQVFQAMSLSPILATFVRHLYISVDFPNLKQHPQTDTEAEPITQTSLAAFLSLMIDLEAFTWYSRPLICWRQFTDETQTSLQSLVQTNRHLRKIDMRNTTVTPLFVCLSPKLQTLAIAGLEAPSNIVPTLTDSEDIYMMIQPPRSIQLTTLVFHSHSIDRRAVRKLLGFLQRPKCPISISKLELFDVESQVHENHGEIQTIVNMCKDTLTRFFWNTRAESILLPNNEPVVDLSNLSHLSELRLIGCIIGHCHDYHDDDEELKACPLNYFSNLLSTLPRARTTDGLKLKVHITIYLSNLSVKNVQEIAWGVFVDALLDLKDSDADRKLELWDVSVLMSFTDRNDLHLADTSITERRLAILKENMRLKELGEWLVFM